jgi:hypothetical protein
MVAKKNTTTRSRIRWSADCGTLYFDGRGLKMADWKHFAENLISTAEDLLSQRLLFLDDGSLLEEDLHIMDNPSNHESGHYFVLDEADAWSKARGRVLENLRRSKRWTEVVEVQGDGIEFLKAGIDEYEADDTRLKS